MERTWKPKAAGILCITVGAIWVVSGVVLSAISGAPSFGTFLIPGIMPIVGGVYALRRRRWGLALAGSIFTLLCCVTLGIIFFLGAVADNKDITQSAVTALAIGIIVIVAIFGILPIIFVSLGKREFDWAREFDKAIELNPDNADAYFNRGDAYDEIGEYEKAIADYSKAIELKPGDALAYFNRGNAYGEIREYGKAIADYSRVIELNPGDADTYYNRGLACQEKGELAKAASDLEKCIELSADSELAKAAQQALRKIENPP